MFRTLVSVNTLTGQLTGCFHVMGGKQREMNVEPTPELIAGTDAVLYSHIYYDHFNKSDIETIGRKPEYLVPLNMAERIGTSAEIVILNEGESL